MVKAWQQQQRLTMGDPLCCNVLQMPCRDATFTRLSRQGREWQQLWLPARDGGRRTV
jgi:hypothetical protein